MAISKQTVTVGILAVASGLAAAYGMRAYLQREPPPPPVAAPAPPKPLTVPIATLDLPAGRIIAVGDLAGVPMTQEKISKQFPLPELLMLSGKDIIGRRLRVPMRQGDSFLTTAFYPAGDGPNLTEKLKPGYRVVNLYLTSGRTNGVVPGAFADVLFRTVPRPGKFPVAPIREMVVTLLTNVEVLDFVSASGSSSNGGPGLVALAVPVDQVGRIEVLQGRGDFSIVPRAIGDGAMLASMRSDRTTIEDALGIEPPTPPTPPTPPRPPFQTIIYRRTDAKINTFVDNQLTQQSQIPGNEHVPAADSSGGDNECPTCNKNRAAASSPEPTFTPQPTRAAPRGK